MPLSFSTSGSYDNIESWLRKAATMDFSSILNRYGQAGVDALAGATPVRTGLTAASWRYRIVQTRGGAEIQWYNTNVQNGSVIAVLIQYGHGTGTGGYVHGIDYINPAIRPIFEGFANDIVREVKA